jgi:hypothetical protein
MGVGKGNVEIESDGAVTAGAPPVATGRVFVRFADGMVAAEAADKLRAAGYEIERALDWAPNAIWVRPDEGPSGRKGRPADPRALEKIPGVVKVEPELLRPRAKKSPSHDE